MLATDRHMGWRPDGWYSVPTAIRTFVKLLWPLVTITVVITPHSVVSGVLWWACLSVCLSIRSHISMKWIDRAKMTCNKSTHAVTLVRRISVTTWLAAAKLGRSVLSGFWTHVFQCGCSITWVEFSEIQFTCCELTLRVTSAPPIVDRPLAQLVYSHTFSEECWSWHNQLRMLKLPTDRQPNVVKDVMPDEFGWNSLPQLKARVMLGPIIYLFLCSKQAKQINVNVRRVLYW